ncbi:MAG: molybdenum cofactor biosynthesis enzyme [Eggerthellaceae bacterium]|nr:molybdenum cofactor biosynthesis enzyme [Eggerthellaceae bacterium]
MDRLIRDEDGITSVGMAIALFITLALIFSGAQMHKVQSAAAEIQEVADACALAADNEVAGFMAVANTCDAACLTFTLTAAVLYGVGLVAACVPPAHAVSVKLMDAASKTVKLRGQFYERACEGLNAAQRLMPFLAACNAHKAAKANDQGAMQADHMAAAVLVPADFTPLGEPQDDGLDDLSSQIDSEADGIRQKAQEAEEAAKAANAAKERGFMEDCGGAPAYCMMERAGHLASLPAADNPDYESVDAWSFSVALERAKAYYAKRLANWTLEGSSVEEKADSVIRKRFYQYAVDELASAYVIDGDAGFSADIPHFFRNMTELKATPLYTESAYPITSNGGKRRMHAWSGCPRASGAIGEGSVAQLEADSSSFEKCPSCQFRPSSVGSVAAASTNISNGFESHYEAMRQACEEYAEARALADPLANEVKAHVQPLLDALGTLLGNAGSLRIHAEPPGRYGALAMVVNTAASPSDTGFVNAFTGPAFDLGVRVAVSAATDVEDETESAGALATQAVSSITGGLGGIGAGISGAAGIWMSVLRAYEDGQAALERSIEEGLGSFSQNSSSGLGKWAAKVLSQIVEAAGLEPADTACTKPVVLNTTHVASSSDDAVCVRFMSAKDSALAASSPDTSLAGSVLAAMGVGSGSSEGATGSGSLNVAEIELPFGGSGSISWAIPKAQDVEGVIGSGLAALGGLASSIMGDRSWA